MVEIAIPFTPYAGKKNKPNINIGFKIKLMKKDKINTFLYVFVSPSACSKEFKATTNINKIEPENIILVYSSPNLITSGVVTIN